MNARTAEAVLSPLASRVLADHPEARSGPLGQFVEDHAECGVHGRPCPANWPAYRGVGCEALLELDYQLTQVRR